MDFGVALTEDDYKHFSVLRSNPNEISDACDICAVSSTNNQKIDEIIYGKQLTNIEQKRQYVNPKAEFHIVKDTTPIPR